MPSTPPPDSPHAATPDRQGAKRRHVPVQRYTAVSATEDNRFRQPRGHRRRTAGPESDSGPVVSFSPAAHYSPPRQSSLQRDDDDDGDASTTAPGADPPTSDADMPLGGATFSSLPSKPSMPSLSATTTDAAVAPAQHTSASSLDRAKWEWMGESFNDPHDKAPTEKQIYTYYERVRCVTGDFELALGDGVHLKSADAHAALPYVARVRGLCEERNPRADGTHTPKLVIIEWFFRPEDLRSGRLPSHGRDELFMRRRGRNVLRYYSLDCVESRCTVFDYPEYCRRRAAEARAVAAASRRRVAEDAPRAAELDGAAMTPHELMYFVRDWYDNEDLYRVQHSHHKRTHTGGGGGVSTKSKQPRMAEVMGVTRDTVNRRNIKGETKLHQACIRGNIDQVRALMRLNASVDVTCNAGWTPLHEACCKNHVAIADLLLRNDADPNVPSPDGTLPLHDAAANGSLELVTMLVRYGASAEIPDREGKLPADLADGNRAVLSKAK